MARLIGVLACAAVLGCGDSPSEPPPDATLRLTGNVTNTVVEGSQLRCEFQLTITSMDDGDATWQSGTATYSAAGGVQQVLQLSQQDMLDWWGSGQVDGREVVTIGRWTMWDRAFLVEHIFRYETPRGEMKSTGMTLTCNPPAQ